MGEVRDVENWREHAARGRAELPPTRADLYRSYGD